MPVECRKLEETFLHAFVDGEFARFAVRGMHMSHADAARLGCERVGAAVGLSADQLARAILEDRPVDVPGPAGAAALATAGAS